MDIHLIIRTHLENLAMTVLPPFSSRRLLRETLDDMGQVKVGEEFLKIICGQQPAEKQSKREADSFWYSSSL
jgi:hypothetical protein